MEKFKTDKIIDLPETMLITLWAKAAESKRPNPIIVDKAAEEMLEKVDYDFSRFKKLKLSRTGVAIRAKVIDEQVEKFLASHPDAVVVHIGAGVDDRFARLGRPNVTHWYDIDLPEAIALRFKLVKEAENNTFLPISIFDYPAWVEKVKSHGKPVMFIAEGVFMFFNEAQVKELFNKICDEFPEAKIVFDMLAYFAYGKAHKHEAMKLMKNVPRFDWSVLDSKEVEKWNSRIHLENEVYMSDALRGRLNWIVKLMYKIPSVYQKFNQRMVTYSIK